MYVNIRMNRSAWARNGRHWKMQTKQNVGYPGGMQRWGWNREREERKENKAFPYIFLYCFILLQWTLSFVMWNKELKVLLKEQEKG